MYLTIQFGDCIGSVPLAKVCDPIAKRYMTLLQKGK